MKTVYKLTTESHWGNREEKYYTSMRKVNQQIKGFKVKIAEREKTFKEKKIYPYDIVDYWWVKEIEVL